MSESPEWSIFLSAVSQLLSAPDESEKERGATLQAVEALNELRSTLSNEISRTNKLFKSIGKEALFDGECAKAIGQYNDTADAVKAVLKSDKPTFDSAAEILTDKRVTALKRRVNKAAKELDRVRSFSKEVFGTTPKKLEALFDLPVEIQSLDEVFPKSLRNKWSKEGSEEWKGFACTSVKKLSDCDSKLKDIGGQVMVGEGGEISIEKLLEIEGGEELDKLEAAIEAGAKSLAGHVVKLKSAATFIYKEAPGSIKGFEKKRKEYENSLKKLEGFGVEVQPFQKAQNSFSEQSENCRGLLSDCGKNVGESLAAKTIWSGLLEAFKDKRFKDLNRSIEKTQKQGQKLGEDMEAAIDLADQARKESETESKRIRKLQGEAEKKAKQASAAEAKRLQKMDEEAALAREQAANLLDKLAKGGVKAALIALLLTGGFIALIAFWWPSSSLPSIMLLCIVATVIAPIRISVASNKVKNQGYTLSGSGFEDISTTMFMVGIGLGIIQWVGALGLMLIGWMMGFEESTKELIGIIIPFGWAALGGFLVTGPLACWVASSWSTIYQSNAATKLQRQLLRSKASADQRGPLANEQSDISGGSSEAVLPPPAPKSDSISL